MVGKELIGKTFERFSYTVEKGKIAEFCLAIGDQNPLFFDKNKALEAGHPASPIPLTFQTLFVFWGFPKLWDALQNIGIDTGKMLHLKEEYDYFSPIYPGLEVFGQMEVIDVITGKLNMVTFKTDFTDSENKLLITSRMTVVLGKD